ncbi:hypothetical protein AA106556_0182 [Neokomagataea tanensis NBRC 106556]|uniref:Hedgehog/Intein (Hint) domain-containing protein n=2 Tax=Acetobacteraceae TaxID=433 RepID=A0ABQ0QGB0_9PROT|nr:hypothetical protein AA106556_0182 [Neokomagataea tanensis NBRC 106556]
MNDPQPAFYQNGVWTLYALTDCNYPNGNGTSWSRWTSTDLTHWTNQGTAIQKYTNEYGDPWSGTIIADTENTAGFGSNAIIALTTVSGKEGEGQSTALWVSQDNGKSFYFDKIVMPNPYSNTSNANNAQAFRDPRVTWMADTKSWVMTLAENHKISFYTSTDLQNWHYQSGFTNDTLNTLGAIECPTLFPIALQDANGNIIGSKWILMCSANGYQTGFTTGAHYWSGEMVNGTFVADDTRGSWLDSGSDFYAATVYAEKGITSTPQTSYYATAWKNNWEYANKVTGAGYYGDMTRTRVLTFHQTDQGQKLFNDVLWHGKPFVFDQVFGSEVFDRPLTPSTPQLLDRMSEDSTSSSLFFASFSRMGNEWPDTITITLQSGAGTPITLILSPQQNSVQLQRSESGYTPDMSSEWQSPRNAFLNFGNKVTVFALINKNGIEVIFNNVALSMTSLVFPTSKIGTPEITVSNGQVNIDHFGVGPLPGDQQVLNTDNDHCFLAGTLIETPDGDVPIETITVGAQVAVYKKEGRIFQPVIWSGARFICTDPNEADPERARAPVRIVKGALGDNIPYTDLLVTPDHGLYLDGALVPARMLVNGSSIRYDRNITEYWYHHIQCDEHSLIRACGALSESYLDAHNIRRLFAGQDVQPEPYTKAKDSLRLRTDRPFVEAMFHILAARCGAAALQPETTRDTALKITAEDGRPLTFVRRTGRYAIFRIPAQTRHVHLISKADRQDQAIGPFMDDRRMLGLLVGAIQIWTGDTSQHLNHHLTAAHLPGWHGLEAPNMRWTNGNAYLPLSDMHEHERLLSIEIINTALYRVTPEHILPH